MFTLNSVPYIIFQGFRNKFHIVQSKQINQYVLFLHLVSLNLQFLCTQDATIAETYSVVKSKRSNECAYHVHFFFSFLLIWKKVQLVSPRIDICTGCNFKWENNFFANLRLFFLNSQKEIQILKIRQCNPHETTLLTTILVVYVYTMIWSQCCCHC